MEDTSGAMDPGEVYKLGIKWIMHTLLREFSQPFPLANIL